uniref:ABC-type cobalamin/Fe3+-siderophores transport systems, ATPase components n=1 Tax=uncultured gamma proteobacterium HF0200_24F15 TaxID=723570 RepID=E7C3Z4_9GAMM|nr:ABC-type cobalamin/Fe3+-siderophores transport systems, ATPase components [uncultured gamma proteobacterium HF0200_24F15]
MKSLKVDKLTIKIGSVIACHDLSVTFHSGQVWSVLGRNGIGKSTLLHTMAGLRRPSSGLVLWDNISLDLIARRKRAQTIGILFQEQDPTFPATVLETVLTGRHPWLSPFQGEGETDIAMAIQEIHRMDLKGMENRELSSLSGGERRRVDLAALVLQRARLALLDEPANHLDLHYQVDLIGQLIDEFKENDSIVIMVMHDVNLATRFSDHLLLLFGDGETQHGNTSELATAENFSRLYGHPLNRYQADGQHYFLPE